MKPPVLALGEVVAHSWCATCQAPSRVRAAVHATSPGGVLLGTLEVCPGCGANHAEPSVALPAAPRPRLLRPLRRRTAWTGLCAAGGCRMPGRKRYELTVPGEAGTWRYRFCTRKHRDSWAAEHWVTLPGGQPEWG